MYFFLIAILFDFKVIHDINDQLTRLLTNTYNIYFCVTYT